MGVFNVQRCKCARVYIVFGMLKSYKMGVSNEKRCNITYYHYFTPFHISNAQMHDNLSLNPNKK
jgi:hypothetical protein